MLQMPTRKKTKLTETVPSEAGNTVFKAEATMVSSRYEGNKRLLLPRQGRTPANRQRTPAKQTNTTNGLARVGTPAIVSSVPQRLLAAKAVFWTEYRCRIFDLKALMREEHFSNYLALRTAF
jgi:hypothetical protein